MKTAVEKAQRSARLNSRVHERSRTDVVGFRSNSHRVSRVALMGRIEALRIYNAAREVNGVFVSSPLGDGHTCDGDVRAALTCKKCLARKPKSIPMNAWAKLQEERRAIAPAKTKTKKRAHACPSCRCGEVA